MAGLRTGRSDLISLCHKITVVCIKDIEQVPYKSLEEIRAEVI